ncbi:TetR/AcrR family transcriptional regulator [Kribbella sp. VKM Ac-2568]|uniref:TetR/AcrR family transcriptional regulator n=1 Tax=Kribbella sp. VKM Ac-2568 TaxID=2512219 RepID=UPI0010475BDD|nr:TetR/AcrR family transcriptional regulator [Kribbella sp. VKM Ac-2568]TCM45862.1 TetR family transcriptional regulator [Kribbella sp. VKM Ac-2568]
METPRQRQHRQTMADILRIAHGQLVTEGSAGLSLRAIARELGLVSSAIYRYVPSRDELLTLLIEESYTAFGDAVEAAEARCRREDLGRRWLTVGRAVRRWAVANPAEWALLYGSPVPGYHAPPERTTAAGSRVPFLVLQLLADADLQPASDDPPMTAALHRELDKLRPGLPGDLKPEVLARGLLAFSSLCGLVSLELFGQFTNTVTQFPAHLDHQLTRLGATLGIPEPT